jgi:isochorismate pyruvate lyase
MVPPVHGKNIKAILAPADCRTMAEVRFGVDRLDEKIVTCLSERFRYMEAAARIKTDRGAVRDESRKAQVLANVTALARQRGLPPAVAGEFYEALIEASIAYELDLFDKRHSREVDDQ